MIYFYAMKTLFLETSTEKSCIAISDGEKIISIPLFGGPQLSKKIALEVSNLLKENNFQPEQILVGAGPGSLTGVRVGMALGKALAFAWNIPYIEFCSLKSFFTEGAVLVDARQAGIYVLINDAVELLAPTEAEEKVKNISKLYSPHPALIEKRIVRTVLEANCSFKKE
jgi:tRNA threonylcarbamoyl adenosine modification protein YeaZ